MKTSSSIPLRIALYYALFGGIWILSTDSVLEALVSNTKTLTQIQIYKGWTFVAASALVIFLLLRRELKRRHITEGELEESKRRYHTAFDAILEGVQIVDRDWRFVYVNEAVARQGRSTRADLVGRTMMDVYPGIEKTEMFARLRDCMENRIPTQFENEFKYADGSAGWFNLSVQSTLEGILILSFDITERKRAEKTLAYQSFLLENVNDAILATDEHRYITSWNRAAEKMFGWTKEEALGRPAGEIIISDFSDEQRNHVINELAEKGQYKLVLRAKRKDGEAIWVEGINSILREQAGGWTGYVSINRDITERKNAEQTIARRLAELELLYQSGLTISGELDPKQIAGKLIEALEQTMDWHHIAIRQYDAERDHLELLAFNQPSLESETERLAMQSRFNQLIANTSQGLSGWVVRNGQAIRSDNVHADERYIEVNPGIHSGLYVPIMLGGRVLGVISAESRETNAFRDADERLLKTVANQAAVALENARLFQSLQRELGERALAEQKLRQSEEQYRFLLDNTSDFIAIFDRNGVMKFGTEASLRFNGYRPDEIVNTLSLDRIHPDDRALARQELERVLRDNTEGRAEYRVKRKDGEYIWVEASGRRVQNAVGEPEVIIVQRDITERKRAEKEIELLARFPSENPSPVLRVGMDGRLLYANHASAPLLEMWKCNVGEFLPEEWKERIAGCVERGAQEQTDVEVGARVFLVMIAPIQNEDYVNLYGKDITERKQAETALRESEGRFRSFIKQSSDGLIIANELGIIIEWNPALYHITGLTREQALGMTMWDLQYQMAHPDQRAGLNPENLKKVMTGMLQDGHSMYFGQVQDAVILTTQGERKYIQQTSFPIPTSNGYSIGGIVRDVTERKQAEEDLRASEARYRALFEDSPIAIWEEDFSEVKKYLDGLKQRGIENFTGYFADHRDDLLKCAGLIRIMDINRSALEMYQAEEKDGLLENANQTISDGELAHLPQILADIAAGKLGGGWEGEDETLAGNPIEIRLTWSIIPGYEEDYSKVIVTTVDITERKRAEEELRESETRYRYLFETNPHPMWVYDLKTLAFLAVNDAAIAKYGYARDEFLNMTIADIRPAEDLPRLRENLAAPRNALEYSEGWRHRLKDGRLIEVAITSHTILLDQRDAVLVVAQDITERKQAEDALQKSEERFRTVADFTYDWEYWLDENRQLLYISPSCKRVTGYERDEFLNDPNLLQSIIHPEDRETVTQHVIAEFQKSDPASLDFRIITADGQERWVAHSCQQVYGNNGQARGRRVSNRDITERKKSEEQIVALENFTRASIDALSANICVIDETGRIMMVNRSWRDFALANNEEPEKVSEGVNYFAVCENATGVERLQAMEFAAGIRLVLSGKCAEFSMEYPCHSKQEKRWFIARVTRFQNNLSNRAAIAHMNITGRKLVEEALQVSETRFSTVFHSSPNPIAITRLSDGKLLDMNETWQAVTGYAWEEAIGRSPIELDLWVEPSERARLTQKVAEHETVRAFEMQMRRKSGEIRMMLMSAEIVKLQEELCVLSTAQDITELKQAEQSIRHYTQQLETAGEMGRTLASQLDVEKIYETLGQAVKRLLPDVDSVYVSRFAPEEQTITPVYGMQNDETVDISKLPPLPLPPDGQGVQSDVIRTGKAVILADLQKRKTGRFNVRAGTDAREIRSSAYIPLAAHDQMLGVLQVQSDQRDRFGQTDIELLTLVGNTAAIAIQNAELFTETRQRVRELETVNHISVALRASANQEQALAIMLEEILNVFNTRHGAISLWDDETETLREAIARGWLAAITERPIRSGEGIFGTVFASGETHISADFSSDPLVLPQSRPLLPIGWGGASIPIRANEKILGVLTLAIPSQRVFRREDIRLLETLAEMAGASINRMSLNEEVQRHLERLQSLRQIDAAITGSFDRRATLETILTQVISQLGVSAADILMLDHKKQALHMVAYKGFITELDESVYVPIGKGFAGIAVSEKRIVRADPQSVRDVPEFYKLWQKEGFSSYHAIPLIVKGRPIGVLETYQRTLSTPNKEWLNFLETLAGQAGIALENAGLFENLENANAELMQAYDSTIEGWSHAMDLRDKETEGHTVRVADLTLRLARAMSSSEAELIHIRRGALLHDIGKIGVPDRILLKPDKLTDEEWTIMRMHPTFAYEMLEPIQYLKPALNIPYCHHEKWDGSGYPRGLAGQEIPIEARIFAVVDVWDALTSDRPYRPAWSREKTLEYIRAQAGEHFDPDIVSVFLQIIETDEQTGLQSDA